MSRAALEEELREAARGDDAARVVELLGAGVDPRAPDTRGDGPLAMAVRAGSLKAMEALLARVDPMERDRYGFSALHSAADAERAESARALLALPGVDPNARDNDGQTAMHWSALHGDIATTRVLLGAVDSRAVCARGRTAAALARQMGREELASLIEGWERAKKERAALAAETAQRQGARHAGALRM